MASKAVQMVCVTLAVIGLIGVITCCALPQWKVTAFIGANILTEQVIYEGLWMSCVTHSTGQKQCKVYDSMLALPFDLQVSQALTFISCILCGLSLLVLFWGADFTRCEQNKNKTNVILVGVGLLLAGLLVIIPVSWSAHTIIRDFYNPVLTSAQKLELGVCIYTGWAAGVLLILTGVLLCCFGRPRSSSSGGTARYHSNRASGPNDDTI